MLRGRSTITVASTTIMGMRTRIFTTTIPIPTTATFAMAAATKPSATRNRSEARDLPTMGSSIWA
jgi:hypothetical protein